MSKYDRLKKHFAEWKVEHNNPTVNGKAIGCTIPKKVIQIRQDSFTKDGLLCESTNDVDILFILKESNVSDEKSGVHYSDGNYFWFKENLDEYLNNDKKKTINFDDADFIKYYEKITVCAKVIFDDRLKCDFCWYKDKDKIAYMNINKRGGFGSTDNNTLRNYIEIYGSRIKEQIEIIRPKIIIIMGNDAFALLTSNKAKILTQVHEDQAKKKVIPIRFKEKNRNFFYTNAILPKTQDNHESMVEIFSAYHPAATYGNNSIFSGKNGIKMYEECFREAWNKINDKS